jgi:hypothetical protein
MFIRFFFAGAFVKRDVQIFGTAQSIKCFPKKYFDPAVDDPYPAARKENSKRSPHLRCATPSKKCVSGLQNLFV